MCSQWGRWGKISAQTFSNLFFKTLAEGAVTTEAGSLFQYFHSPHRKCRPSPSAVARTLEGCPLRPRQAGRRMKKPRVIALIIRGHNESFSTGLFSALASFNFNSLFRKFLPVFFTLIALAEARCGVATLGNNLQICSLT